MTRRRTKATNRKDSQIEFLQTALEHNVEAKKSKKVKTWSIKDIAVVKPLTPAQEDLFHAWINGFSLCAHGSAGTGKTFLGLYLALNSVLSGEYQKIVIVRSVVPTREMGFLPGDVDEKTSVYEEPYRSIFHELLGKQSSYDDLKSCGKIEFMSTSFIRGITIDSAVIIMDESQNNTFHELSSVLTRVGENTRVICTGDVIQSDLKGYGSDTEGMTKAMGIFKAMNQFAMVEFNHDDIVRSEFVKQWIIASEMWTS